MIVVPVTQNIRNVADAVTLAVCYRLITEVIFATINDNAVVIIIMDDLTVTSAVCVGFLRHTGNPYGNLTH